MSGPPLAALTTLRLGGPARRLVRARSTAEVVETVARADEAGEPLLVIGGGSNLVVADAGFDGTVLQVASRGVSVERRGDRVRLVAAAGEPWDELVERCVADGLAGLECLSGIPGLTGATPIQNVGAYGQELSEAVTAVTAYDRAIRAVVELGPEDCEFSYRSSAFKGSSRYVVLGVTLELRRSPTGMPPLSEVRDAVLALRREKGMVIDPADPDSVSAGSFFLNPILPADRFTALERRARVPAWPASDGHIKTSAAWLIEHAGFPRGYGRGRVGISTKHTLALVNRGGATTAELLTFARELRDGVRAAYGIALQPEPTFVGVKL